jgi:hypothetical protein
VLSFTPGVHGLVGAVFDDARSGSSFGNSARHRQSKADYSPFKFQINFR